MKINFIFISSLALAWAASCLDAPVLEQDPQRPTVDEDPTARPLPGISSTLQLTFDKGDAAFEARFFPSQGLGPLYIRTACASCHAGDGKGPGFVTKMVVLDDDGVAVAAALPFGGTQRPFFQTPATQPLSAPVVDGSVLSTRMGPAVFGRGYVEAVAESELQRVAEEQAARGDGISGRIHRVTYNIKSNPDSTFNNHTEGQAGLVGRFGLKGRIASVDEFVADALQGDIGITSPLRPTELPNPDGALDDAKAGVDVDADFVNTVGTYIRLLEIPRRTFRDQEAGAELFARVDCAVCHVPSLRTDPEYPLAPLADVDAPIFSDLLLHDMGEALSDSFVEGDASGAEWKTPPLIGIRFFDGWLHDNRASTVDEAIEFHASVGSEANAAVDLYHQLSEDERALLVSYVESL